MMFSHPLYSRLYLSVYITELKLPSIRLDPSIRLNPRKAKADVTYSLLSTVLEGVDRQQVLKSLR